ncbi:MAG: helix-turn-helix domain-containing protein [Cyanobacteria bacterium J06649_4]
MDNKTPPIFSPDWISPPGDTIADLLEERDWTQAQLAERLGYTTKHVSQLINGKAPISEHTAIRLEHVLGSSVRFWLNREALYRAQLVSIEETSRLQSWIPWLDLLPVKDLMHQGIIPEYRLVAKNKPKVVKSLLQFFSVSSPEEWEGIYSDMAYDFRRTRESQSNVGAISAWIRQGETIAEQLDCPKYNRSKFEKAVKQFRRLTLSEPQSFIPTIQALCQESGVAFVIVPSIPRAHVSGMARWLNPHKALIQVSLYGKKNDLFWFTLFHEAAHILFHEKKHIFLDEWDSQPSVSSDKENEANQWARDFLIPPEYEPDLPRLSNKKLVVNFSRTIGVHPAIVVGRLQHDGFIRANQLNALKVRIPDVSFRLK